MSCCSLQTVGALFLLYWLVVKPLRILYRWHKNRNSTRSEEILKPGPHGPTDYAVITGATDGIGLEYARQLGEKGYNLVLISRTEEKLKKVAKEIQEQYPQVKKVEIITADFTQTDIYDRIQSKLESLGGPIHVLVNNVGMLHPCPEYFASHPDNLHQNLINVNIVSMTRMSEIALRIVTKQKVCPVNGRPKGVIINISSGAGLLEIPLMATYGASKAYMNYLSKTLSIEYAKENIIVQTVTPNQVDTKMAATLYNATFAVSAKDFVKYALKSVGAEQQTSAHPKHKLLNHITAIVGNCLCDKYLGKLMLKSMQKVRDDYEKKFK